MMVFVRHVSLSISLFTEKESKMINPRTIYDEKTYLFETFLNYLLKVINLRKILNFCHYSQIF